MSSDAITAYNSAIESCIAAQEAGDYRSALINARTARLRLTQIPDSEFDEEKLTWDRKQLTEVIDDLKSLANSQAPSSASEDTVDSSTPFMYGYPVLYKRG